MTIRGGGNPHSAMAAMPLREWTRRPGALPAEADGWLMAGDKQKQGNERAAKNGGTPPQQRTPHPSRMHELGPYGSVRGARGNSRPYRGNKPSGGGVKPARSLALSERSSL